MRLLRAVLGPLLALELGPKFLRPVIARREYKALRCPQSGHVSKVIQEGERGDVQQRYSCSQIRCNRCCKYPCYRTFACTPLHRLGILMSGFLCGMVAITGP